MRFRALLLDRFGLIEFHLLSFQFSVLDIRKPVFTADGKMEMVKSYMDSFPFPYYVIVRDLAQLPLVLSDAMRQWFELVSSEQ